MSLGAFLRSRGVRFTAVAHVGVYQRRHNDLVGRACREFDLVTSVDSRALLLRVRDRPEPTADTPTCGALAPWRAPEPMRPWRRPPARLPWQRETATR